jgi:hypothetical protein
MKARARWFLAVLYVTVPLVLIVGEILLRIASAAGLSKESIYPIIAASVGVVIMALRPMLTGMKEPPRVLVVAGSLAWLAIALIVIAASRGGVAALQFR